MKPSKLFSDLSSDARLAIIMMLDEERSFTEIKNYVGVSSPEVSRHLRRLSDSFVIEKKRDGLYVLTSLGQFVRSMYFGVDAITNHLQFFIQHDISAIPEMLRGRMDMLVGCKVLQLYPAMEKIMMIDEDTELYWDISENVPPTQDDDEGRARFLSIPDIRSIITLHLTRGYYDESTEKKYYETVRVLDEINYSVTINGDKALIALPTHDGKIDRNHYLYGDSDAFVNWCKQFFQYYWEKAKTIPPFD